MNGPTAPTSGLDQFTAATADLLRRVADLERAAQRSDVTAWTGVTFATGWTNLGGSYQTVQYRKVGDIVHARGVLGITINRAAGAPIFTFPAGFRPPADLITVQFGVPGVNQGCRFDVSSAGVASAPIDAFTVGFYLAVDLQFSVTA